MINIEARLAELKALGLDRRTRLVSGPQGPHALVDGKPVLMLCSENYLGLADHPSVRRASAEAALRWGAGAGASRVQSGTMTIHRRLQDRLAAFIGRERAILFGSGYLAATGTISSLARPGDVIFSDERNHTAIRHGCRLSDAEVFVYDHGDLEHLRWGISHAEGRGALIVTESLFESHGDRAPLEEIVELAGRFELRTVVDESHALGALGPQGRGALAAAGLEERVDVIVGTLGKGIGGYGGLVACDETMARYLTNAAPTFIFGTAPAPPTVAAALAALDQIAERPRRAQRLAANAGVLRDGLRQEGLEVTGGDHILTVQIGDAVPTRRICEAALVRGVFVQGVRPPAVAPARSLLRMTVMATHAEEELRVAAHTLGSVARGSRMTAEPGASLAALAAEQTAVATADAQRAAGAPGVFDFEAAEPVRRAA
jgi:glycine C-acetyltransferase/8-amino-7-oxononanoate synthase